MQILQIRLSELFSAQAVVSKGSIEKILLLTGIQSILDLVLKCIKREVSHELKFNFILIIFMFTDSRVKNYLIRGTQQEH